MLKSFPLALLIVALTSPIAVLAYESSPSTFSPDVVQISSGEQCVKEAGKLKCRWGGECKKKGNSCYSCGDGLKWSDDLNACYSCVSGTSLVQKNGKMVCSDGK